MVLLCILCFNFLNFWSIFQPFMSFLDFTQFIFDFLLILAHMSLLDGVHASFEIFGILYEQ